MTCRGVITFLLVTSVAAAFPTPQQQEDPHSDLDSNKLSKTEVNIPTVSADILSDKIVENGSGSPLGDEKICTESSKAFDNSSNSIESSDAAESSNGTSNSSESIDGKLDDGQVEDLPSTCYVPTSFTIVYTDYRFSEDGKLIPYNVTRQVLTQDCCEGYLRTVKGCVRDFCKYFHCNEDPNSRCVMVQRCGHVFPIFVTDQGILSEKCTQPKVSVAHLCPSDACSADSACNAKGAVCLANSCGCSSTAGPYWQFENLEEAQC